MPTVTGNGTAVTGLGGLAGYGETMLTRADDAGLQVGVSTVFENGVTIGGANYSAQNLFVSTDGLISFGGPVTGVQADLTALTMPFIAPFHADVDTRLDGEGDESGPVWVDVDAASDVVTVTWADVGFYRRNASLTNVFQVQLYDRGSGGMDIVMRYQQVEWVSGDLEGGWGGLGGTPALIGLRLGATGAASWLPASGNEAAQLSLSQTLGNTGVSGLWQFSIAPNVVVPGSGNNDLLTGTPGDDTLNGGAGNDTLRGMAGADNLQGGTGFDYVDYRTSTTGLRVDLGQPGTCTGDAAGDSFSEIEGIYGSAFGDVLLGDGVANRIEGRDGNDTLYGGDGKDTLYGGNGDDVFFGGTGGDYVHGAVGRDTLSYADATSFVRTDLTYRGQNLGDALGDYAKSIEVFIGSDFGDAMLGRGGDDWFEAGAGNDLLVGRAGNDHLFGGAGDDTLNGGKGSDALFGGAGRDTASYEGAIVAVLADLAAPALNTYWATGDSYDGIEDLTGSSFHDSLFGDVQDNILSGGAGNDGLFGRGGNDTLRGDTGDDSLEGGQGADVLDGGAGIDTAIYTNATSAIVLDLAAPGLSAGEAAGDVLIAIERIAGSGFADSIFGDDLANVFFGGAGNDALQGRGGADSLSGDDGDDVLDGGAGADTLAGGAGFDWASYANSATRIVLDLASMAASTGDAAGDVFTSIEAYEGTAFNDDLRGDGLANLLYGGAGNDLLAGRSGDDALFGGLGADTLSGDAGNDTLSGGLGGDVLNGGTGTDFASYATASAGIAANLGTPAGNTDEAAGDSYILIEGLIGSAYGDTLAGSSAADILDGGAGADVLTGSAGNDTLLGGAGDDVLFGGLGADFLDGGDGFDWADFSMATTALIIDMATPALSTGEAAFDVFINIEGLRGSDFNDRFFGDAFANSIEGGNGYDSLTGRDGNDSIWGGYGSDTLDGGAGADWLSGGAGNDSLIGGTGNDTVAGGAGSDRFVHSGSAADGTDLVLDYFGIQADKLVYSGSGAFRAQFGVTYVNQPGVGAANIAEAVVTHVPTGRVLWVIADGQGMTDLFLQIGYTTYDLI